MKLISMSQMKEYVIIVFFFSPFISLFLDQNVLEKFIFGWLVGWLVGQLVG